MKQPPEHWTWRDGLIEPGPAVVVDIDGVLCYKEVRKVARDNTVQYHGKTLQIFPGPERTSYARAHVEVQERLDGRLVICYRGKVLTPFEAPPLALQLRAKADAGMSQVTPWYVEPEEPETKKESLKAQPGKIWWEDSDLRRRHRELVRAGMQQARESGKRIGRPRVSERPDFNQRFQAIADRLDLGLVSRRQAARELNIGYATLKRLLDIQANKHEPIPHEPITIENAYAEVLH